MNLAASIQRRCAWANLPAATLIALLQRTPIPSIVAAADESVAASTAGVFLRSAAVAAAALGAVDSIAGATLLASSLNPEPTGPLPPFDATVGVPIKPVAFTIANLVYIGSWIITGQIPPGLTMTTLQPNGGTLTTEGDLDATTATNQLTTPILEGTPTTPGTYEIKLQGFWKGGESGGPYGGKGVSSVFSFFVIVSAGPPVFATQPMSVTVTGGTVALDAVANGAPSYQWMLNSSTPVAGATGPILLLRNAAAEAGTYSCVATNPQGSATSNPATVSITSTGDIGRLTNISTRSQVGTGANILIAGFVVGGAGTTGSEPLLIRGSGPALAPFGVAGTLPDPQLQLYSGSNSLGTNAGWAGNAKIASTAASVGAFAWASPSSHDAALVEPLAAGAYTAQVAGESGDTGVALAEVYDATPAGTYAPTTPRIVNISARVRVGTGGNILIAGFAIGGSTSRTVLIRASGPALVPFGVAGTLPDPELQLYSGSNVLESNGGWAGDAQVSASAASVGAFPWSSPASNDSAILVTLPPGAYTAQVSGASGDTGISLVEIYEVP
ncbi:MAG TPA: immunoglobulin domain-containing protein [Opitutaceae bacterium]|nr:immunoglobulin domain-containing protein [Opitutaceae bacterium]